LVTDFEGQPSPDWQPLHTGLEPEFYGAGGPRMAAEGVQLALDMTQHSVVGLWEVIKKYGHFRKVFRQLLDLATAREPDAIICIDFSGFNLRFAHAVRRRTRSLRGTFNNWRPRIVQCVSPQVWASRPQRAEWLAQDCDLVLSILPFETDWYARHAPKVRVLFTGHPIVDRYASVPRSPTKSATPQSPAHVLLLPGSRVGELRRHLPVLSPALAELQRAKPRLHTTLVLPNEGLLETARAIGLPPGAQVQVNRLPEVLASADLALAATGTVQLECAYFGVPTVAFYKTSPLTYWVGKRLVNVRFLAMPNLMADEEIYPEFIQDAATPANLARAALDLLDNPARRAHIREQLARIVQSLGPPGASDRAAAATVRLVDSDARPLRAALAR
jgi:lipid-A-disaccharide synthase